MSDWKIKSTTVFQSRFNANANDNMDRYIETVNQNPLSKVCDIKFQADQTPNGSYWTAMVVVCEKSNENDPKRANSTYYHV